jgi:hypothetical protein
MPGPFRALPLIKSSGYFVHEQSIFYALHEISPVGVEGSVPIPVFQLARTISFLESKWSGRDDCLPQKERLSKLQTSAM